MAAKRVKKLYEFECQVCGQTLIVSGKKFSEATHIRPLGSPHRGSDSDDNILSLCPNHRVMFDCGTFAVGEDLGLIGIRLYKRLRVHPRHRLGMENLKYHRDHILEKES